MASMMGLGGHQSSCVIVTVSESLGIEKEKETSKETLLVGIRLDSVRELHHCIRHICVMIPALGHLY